MRLDCVCSFCGIIVLRLLLVTIYEHHTVWKGSRQQSKLLPRVDIERRT